MLLYDLVNAKLAHFSPNAWRARMVLLHKGLEFEVRNVTFTEMSRINPDGEKPTIPTLHHRGKLISDSWTIVQHLDDAFPDKPRMLTPGSDTAVMKFFQHWVEATLHASIRSFILLDLYNSLDPMDKAYFRTSREKRYQQTLEEIQAGREDRLGAFRESLQPLRLALAHGGHFIGGAVPCYADYLAFGAFQWARVSSTFKLLAEDDPLHAWLERCLDLYNGAARKEAAA